MNCIMVTLVKVWVCRRFYFFLKIELAIERVDLIHDSIIFVVFQLYELLWKIFPFFLLGIWSMQADWDAIAQGNNTLQANPSEHQGSSFFSHVLLGWLCAFPKSFACYDLLHRRVTIHGMLRYFLVCGFPCWNVLYSHIPFVPPTVFEHNSNISRPVSLLLNSQVSIRKSQCSFCLFLLNKLNGMQNPWWFIKWFHCSWKSYSSWPTAAACPSSQYLSLQSVRWIPLYSQLCLRFSVGWSQKTQAVCSIQLV